MGSLQMTEHGTPGEYTVKLMLQVPGPLYPRRKYKEYRLLTVEGTITLPFVPYPGLYLAFSKPRRKKKAPVKLHLRIHTVEWQVSERHFECVADETFAREPGFELQEVRGSPHIETHFVELQKHSSFWASMYQQIWTLFCGRCTKRRTEPRLARVRITSISARDSLRSNRTSCLWSLPVFCCTAK
jgi:hypothetical protein